MNRIKTNIVELSKLQKQPCEIWLKRFKHGSLDAHEAFKKYGQQYFWLYKHSLYDLIGWEIENNVFDWQNNSYFVAKHFPQYLNPEKFNWKKVSWVIAQYRPEHFNPDKFNWQTYSWAVAKYCPDKIDPNKYNWKLHSWVIKKYCPDKLELFKNNHKK